MSETPDLPDLAFPNFLNLPPDLSDPEMSGVMILPLPLDLTCSWKRGTDEGPRAIIEASHHIEFYDEEMGFDPVVELKGVATNESPQLPTDPGMAAASVESLAAGLIREGRLLISWPDLPADDIHDSRTYNDLVCPQYGAWVVENQIEIIITRHAV